MAKKKEELAKSESGLALQKLLLENGAINADALQELMATKGIKATAKILQDEKYRRVDKKREWASEGRELTEEERGVIERLPKVIGKAVALTEEKSIRPLTQSEVDEWAEETLIEREANDILDGLNERRRATFFNVASFLNEGEPLAEHTFTSEKHGVQFKVGKSGRSGAPDFSKLEGQVDDATWESITDEVVKREVNEEKVTQALADGKITMEQFAALVPEKKEWRVLRVDRLKDEEKK